MLEINTNQKEVKNSKTIKRVKIAMVTIFALMVLVKGIELMGYKPSPKDNIVKQQGITTQEIEYLHSMSNTVIKAHQKWGNIKITNNTLENALKIAKYSNDYEILNNVTQWTKGNFSNSVDFHNYLWRELGGTVGRAYDLDNEEITNIKERLK